MANFMHLYQIDFFRHFSKILCYNIRGYVSAYVEALYLYAGQYWACEKCAGRHSSVLPKL